MAGELPAEALDDIMIAANMDNEEPNRAMPGGIPGQHEVMMADFTSDEEDDNVNDGAPARTRQQVVAEEGSGDEDEDEDSEEDVAVSSST